jgi:chemotaxis protein MotA
MILKFFGTIILCGALAVVYFLEGNATFSGDLRIFHWPAMVLTAIGPIGLVLICSDFKIMGAFLKLLFGGSRSYKEKRNFRSAVVLQRVSKEFYSQGPQVFEEIKGKDLPEFLLKAFDRLANRMPTADVKDFLSIERDRAQFAMCQCLHLASLGVRLTPSVGMLGTILGMVKLLSSLEDPSHIGSAMSLALLTTFYGLFFSLAFWTPIQQKVEGSMDAELEGYNQALRWVELLEKRKPANYFADSVDMPTSPDGDGKKRVA